MGKRLNEVSVASPAKDISSQDWNRLVAGLPGAHILQTWEWGQVKSRFGWRPFPRVWRDQDGKVVAAALVLLRSVKTPGFPSSFSVMYVPKGPLLDWKDGALRKQVLKELGDLARQRKAIFIKIDPDVRIGSGIPGEPGDQSDEVGQTVVRDLEERGWVFSSEQIQFRNTVMIDLSPDLEVLLANMKQKTRYNVRLAERKGVKVRKGSLEDISSLYKMYAETSARDGFVIRDEDYYKITWSTFMVAKMAEPLVADVDGEMVAAVVIFRFANKAWYLHGMSRRVHRDKMPNYLLQWEAIRGAKASGCKEYDLWGAPDEFDEHDTLRGVFRFKQGLGGEVVRHVGAWDLPARPMLYRLYTEILPRILDVMRRRGKEHTKRTIESL